ncbi:T9SS type A sorting domain-containing protein, partial [uncultured Maribacter sp.]
GAEVDKNANDLYGCFDLSNSITVVRNLPSVTNKIKAKLYPIPAKNTIHVALETFEKGRINMVLYDFAGNAILNKTKQIENQKTSLDVNTIQAGVYILRIRNENGKSVSKKVTIF